MGTVNTIMAELAEAVRLKSGENGEMTIKQMVTTVAGITFYEKVKDEKRIMRPMCRNSR